MRAWRQCLQNVIVHQCGCLHRHHYGDGSLCRLLINDKCTSVTLLKQCCVLSYSHSCIINTQSRFCFFLWFKKKALTYMQNCGKHCFYWSYHTITFPTQHALNQVEHHKLNCIVFSSVLFTRSSPSSWLVKSLCWLAPFSPGDHVPVLCHHPGHHPVL